MGYQIGVADHNVLSPLGMQWASPEKFMGDWTIANAPQPHWLFDIVTWFGESIGQIEVTYFIYWCLELLAFGIATLLIATKFFPTNRLAISVGFTFLLSQTPWLVMGTGTLQIPYPLPGLLGAELSYLFVALLLVSKVKIASVVMVIATLVHVQVGSLAIVIAVLYLVGMYFVNTKKIEWWLLLGIITSIGILAFNLILRPVASNLSDFVEACETLIPYHCSAHQWSSLWGPWMIPSCFGFLVLVGFTYRLFVKNRLSLYVWVFIIGIPLIGLTLGFIFDLLKVPILGELSQGINIYRIGVLIFPFGIWGFFNYLRFPPQKPRDYFLFLTWCIAIFLFMQQPGAWPTGGWIWNLLLSGSFILVIVYFSFASLRVKSEVATKYLVNFVVISIIPLFIAALIANNGLVIRPLNTNWIPDESRRNWGQEVSEIVPPGQVLTGSPFWTDLRLLTERAIVIDCKYAPYGGSAWREWEIRTNLLGGCKDNTAYEEISPESLIKIADQYKSKYILQMSARFEEIKQSMESLGWKSVKAPDTSLGLPGIFMKVS